MGMADLKAKIRNCWVVGCGTLSTSDDMTAARDEFCSRQRDALLTAMRRPTWEIILLLQSQGLANDRCLLTPDIYSTCMYREQHVVSSQAGQNRANVSFLLHFFVRKFLTPV